MPFSARIRKPWFRVKKSGLEMYPSGERRRIASDSGSPNPSFISFQMLSEFLQDQAALYVSGTMMEQERGQFELVLEFHDELRELVAELMDIGAIVTLASMRTAGVAPSPDLKARLSSLIATRPQHATTEGMVMSGPDGLVQWVNPAFSAMCGYSLDELRGKKLGPILQGPKTDRETAARMRGAVHQHRPCCETILNYHKNGTPYWVEVGITPIVDDAGELLWLVACERELAGRVAA
jgi:PAS domain S-box-containing protein